MTDDEPAPVEAGECEHCGQLLIGLSDDELEPHRTGDCVQFDGGTPDTTWLVPRRTTVWIVYGARNP